MHTTHTSRREGRVPRHTERGGGVKHKTRPSSDGVIAFPCGGFYWSFSEKHGRPKKKFECMRLALERSLAVLRSSRIMNAISIAPLVTLQHQLQDGFHQQTNRLQSATLRVQEAEQRVAELQAELRSVSHDIVLCESAHQDAAAGVAVLRARVDHINRSNQLIADLEKQSHTRHAEKRKAFERQLRQQNEEVYEQRRELEEAKRDVFLDDVAQLVFAQEQAFVRLHESLTCTSQDEADAIFDEADAAIRADEALRGRIDSSKDAKRVCAA